MSGGEDLRQIVINNSHPKIGFIKAVTAQNAIVEKLSRVNGKTLQYFDTSAVEAKKRFKTLSKVQEYHLDRVLEEVLKLRKELKEVKDELQVEFIIFFLSAANPFERKCNNQKRLM